MTGALSPSHWLIILVVVLLLFGAKRLPDAARGVGRSLRIFKAETAALSKDDEAPTAVSPSQPETASGTPGPTPVDPAARAAHSSAA